MSYSQTIGRLSISTLAYTHTRMPTHSHTHTHTHTLPPPTGLSEASTSVDPRTMSTRSLWHCRCCRGQRTDLPANRRRGVQSFLHLCCLPRLYEQHNIWRRECRLLWDCCRGGRSREYMYRQYTWFILLTNQIVVFHLALVYLLWTHTEWGEWEERETDVTAYELQGTWEKWWSGSHCWGHSALGSFAVVVTAEGTALWVHLEQGCIKPSAAWYTIVCSDC